MPKTIKLSFFLCLGVVVAVFAAFNWMLRYEEWGVSADWIKTRGTVSSITCKAINYRMGSGNSTRFYMPVPVFTYEVNGQRYSGYQFSVNPNYALRTENECQALAERYLGQRVVDVWHEQGAPAPAYLNVKYPPPAIEIVLSVFAILFLALGIRNQIGLSRNPKKS
jgi:hypothetical protein